MKYAILLIAASIITFVPVDVFAGNNIDQDNLVSCRRSQEKPPVNSNSDRSGA